MSITIRRINPQVNGDRRNAFIGSCDSVGFWLNFHPHFIKIHKLLSFAVKEFSIFCTEGQRGMYKMWVETAGMKRMNRKKRKRKLNLEDDQHTACLAWGSVIERPCAEQWWWKKIGMCEHRTGVLTCYIIDQLQNERSASNNAWSSRKKVPEWERQMRQKE